MIHASLTNSKIQGKYRHSFWSEIYETVLAWYIAPPTFVALINPHKGKFNVTAKGGLVEEEYVDWGDLPGPISTWCCSIWSASRWGSGASCTARKMKSSPSG
ncbi:hypothetical protein LNP05_01165 [Klebsiella pneumoniae subsp. pneumoniae]|nr:hypothetical protein [Klebsiella pneumoniae subsp. pneumoniae]